MQWWQIFLCVLAAVVVIVLAVVLPLVLIHRPLMAPPSNATGQTAPSGAAGGAQERPNGEADTQKPRTGAAAGAQARPQIAPSAGARTAVSPTPSAAPWSAVTALITSLRAVHGAPPLVYDPSIAAVSSAYAARLLRNGGGLVHSQNPSYGENLASFGGYTNDPAALMAAAVRAWYNEYKQYDYGNPGFTPQTGHFTCLVWRSSTRYGIGVAYDEATRTAVVVMNTAPPGNLDTPAAFRANVLPPS